MHNPRRFHLQREQDVSGVSGTGVVAHGCEFHHGYCFLVWVGPYASFEFFPSMKMLEEVHGHEGKTKVVFIDNA